MAESAHTTAEPERAKQPASPAPTAEGAPQLAVETHPLSAAAGDASAPNDATTARHAALLGDPRLLQRTSPTQRARLIQTMQRGYGNHHVAQVMAQRQALAPPVQREEAPAADPAPTPEQKEAALKAAAAAEAAAAAAKSTGDDQAGKAKGAAAGEKATGQAAKQQAAAAGGAARAAAQQGKGAKKAARAALAGLGKIRPAPAPAVAPAVAPPPGKAPAAPQQDAAFQAVVAKTRRIGAKQRTTAPASSKAAAAQAAAESPAAELASQAQDAQVGKMEQAPAPPFDAAGFKAKLMEKIASLAPKTAEEADKFKEGGKLNSVKGEMAGSVAEEQQQSQGPLEQQAAAAPDQGAARPKPVTPLNPEEAGPAPKPVGAAGAAPKPRTAAEVEQPIREAPKQIDQQMAEADVSEKTLAESNEPQFQTALDAKKEAGDHAKTAPAAFRQSEQAQLEAARTEADGTAQGQLGTMHANRATALGQVAGQQGQAKSKDEQERARIAAEIQTIYDETKANVETKLNGLDAKVNTAFDEGAAAAKKTFEEFVAAKMNAFKEKRYGGWLGWARWAKDKIAGMPGEVNAFYTEGRSLYLKEMDAVINRVVAIVGTAITEAKAEVARGRQRIKEYVAKLPANLQKVGQETAAGVEEKLNGLSEQIQSKEGELIDSLAQKYQENLQAVDARIDELKAANKGLVDKAIDAVGGVIKTILQLKDMLLGVLAKAADAVGKIIKDPIGFLGNLISGVKQGLQGFLANIGTHIQKGLMSWLLGEVAQGGIELPKSFDIKGILMMVMQLLGVTWANLRMRAVKMLGEPVVKVLEGAFKIFQIIQTEGLGGLWEFVKEQLGNLKEMIMDGIKDMVITQVIQAGIQWLISVLGGPAGAFIKACKAIIDIVMWFINNGSRVMSLVSSVLDSVSAIASGSVGQAAKYIEESLAKAIPVVIGFLASLLGLGGFGAKIKNIIQKVQQPINKAIDWVLGKAKAFASKIMGKVKGAFGKGKEDREKQAQTQESPVSAQPAEAPIELPVAMKGASHTLILTPATATIEMASKRDLLSNKIGKAVARMIKDTAKSAQVADLKALGGKAKAVQKLIKANGPPPGRSGPFTPVPPTAPEIVGLISALQAYGTTYGASDIDVLSDDVDDLRAHPTYAWLQSHSLDKGFEARIVPHMQTFTKARIRTIFDQIARFKGDPAFEKKVRDAITTNEFWSENGGRFFEIADLKSIGDIRFFDVDVGGKKIDVLTGAGVLIDQKLEVSIDTTDPNNPTLSRRVLGQLNAMRNAVGTKINGITITDFRFHLATLDPTAAALLKQMGVDQHFKTTGF